MNQSISKNMLVLIFSNYYYFFFWHPLIINFSHIDDKKKSRHIPLFKGHKLGIFAKLTKRATSLKLELSRLIQNSFGLPPWKHFVLICT